MTDAPPADGPAMMHMFETDGRQVLVVVRRHPSGRGYSAQVTLADDDKPIVDGPTVEAVLALAKELPALRVRKKRKKR